MTDYPFRVITQYPAPNEPNQVHTSQSSQHRTMEAAIQEAERCEWNLHHIRPGETVAEFADSIVRVILETDPLIRDLESRQVDTVALGI